LKSKSKPKLVVTGKDTSNMEALEKVLHIIESNPSIYPTHEKYVEALRACVRKAWQFHPIKRLYKEAKVKRIKNPRPNPRRGFEFIKGYTCEICGNDFVERDVEVDHKVGENKFTHIESFHKYVDNILHIAPEDIQILCAYPDTDVRSRVKHSCHKIKSYAEKEGLTFEQATIMKRVISIEKQGDAAVVNALKGFNVIEVPKTKKDRNKLLRKLSLEGL
jgi:hypothetical protein